MTTTKISPELSEMDARDLPDWPDIQQAATLLVAEGDPSERPELPTGTKGCFGCLFHWEVSRIPCDYTPGEECDLEGRLFGPRGCVIPACEGSPVESQ